MVRLSKLSIAALALLTLHALGLAFITSEWANSFASDALQLALGGLAAGACYWSGRNSRNAVRWFWWLTGSWCTLWCCGQALVVYYGHFGPIVHSTVPEFLTFFFAATPLFIALFLVTEQQSERLHLYHLLDTAQVLVVVTAAYFFFIYVPGTLAGEHSFMVLRLGVLHVRNVLIAAGLLLRALFTRSSTLRKLFLQLSAIMGVYALGSWLGNHAEEIWRVQKNWYELGWSLPFALLTVAAAQWNEVGEPPRPAEAIIGRKITGPALVYAAPLLLTLLVMFSNGPGTRAKLTVAALAVAASYVCYSIRLLLVEHRERLALESLAKTEEQLRQSQKMEAIGTLAGGVAHDFNNLLTVINGYSELALDTTEESDPRRGQLEEINRSAKRGADLVRQLLAFSRRQVLQPKVLNLNQVLEGMKQMLDRLIGEQVSVKMQLAPRLPMVKADQGKMEQVVMNLVVNARDAMPSGGKLTIQTGTTAVPAGQAKGSRLPPEPGQYVTLTVADTGVGMDASTQARIFEPFFTTKEMGRGTGLGLSTVYGIVKQSGGWISVMSQPGAGTSFEIFIPQAAETQPHAVAEAPPAIKHPVAAAANGRTVLLVEDDVEIRALAHKILQREDYRVLEAGTSEEAERLNSSHEGEIALVISDVMVPGDDGPSLVKKLMLRRPQLKVLYVSGYTRDKIVDQGVLNTGINFLQKPFTPGELTAKVREVINAPAATASTS